MRTNFVLGIRISKISRVAPDTRGIHRSPLSLPALTIFLTKRVVCDLRRVPSALSDVWARFAGAIAALQRRLPAGEIVENAGGITIYEILTLVSI